MKDINNLNNKLGLLTVLPLLLSITAVRYRISILIPITVLVIFLLVAILPFTYKHENLWLFLIGTISLMPINLFLLKEFPVWQDYLCIAERGPLFIVSEIEALMMLISVEAIALGLTGRLIWRQQYKLRIPELEKNE